MYVCWFAALALTFAGKIIRFEYQSNDTKENAIRIQRSLYIMVLLLVCLFSLHMLVFSPDIVKYHC